MKNPIPLLCAVIGGLLFPDAALAHPLTFNSKITYSAAQPSGPAGSVAQWSGAAFDAANIGGSGVNADGGANNGTANASTRVVNGQPAQGQTFTTGSNPNGYDVSGLAVRLAGYTNNTATGANQTSWDLGPAHSPIIVTIGKVNGWRIRSCRSRTSWREARALPARSPRAPRRGKPASTSLRATASRN
jgi:hypothetical protein